MNEDNGKAFEKGERKSPFFVIAIPLIFLVFTILFLIIPHNCNEQPTHTTLVNADDLYVTKEQFDKIELNMSYENVCKIMDSEGILSAETETGVDVIYKHTMIYTWYNEGDATSSCNITFNNGKVISKIQAGLS